MLQPLLFLLQAFSLSVRVPGTLATLLSAHWAPVLRSHVQFCDILILPKWVRPDAEREGCVRRLLSPAKWRTLTQPQKSNLTYILTSAPKQMGLIQM